MYKVNMIVLFYLITLFTEAVWALNIKTSIRSQKVLLELLDEQIVKAGQKKIQPTESFQKYLSTQGVAAGQAYKAQHLTDYCRGQALEFSKKVQSHILISNTTPQFLLACNTVFKSIERFQTPDIGDLKEYITLSVNAQLASVYVQMINFPFLSQIQKVEQIEAAHSRSILGQLGIGLKQSFLIQQMMILGSLIIASALLVFKLL